MRSFKQTWPLASRDLQSQCQWGSLSRRSWSRDSSWLPGPYPPPQNTAALSIPALLVGNVTWPLNSVLRNTGRKYILHPDPWKLLTWALSPSSPSLSLSPSPSLSLSLHPSAGYQCPGQLGKKLHIARWWSVAWVPKQMSPPQIGLCRSKLLYWSAENLEFICYSS